MTGQLELLVFGSKSTPRELTCKVRFNLAPADAVEVPDELAEALGENAKRRTLWAALTPGRQSGLAHFVSSAKPAPTRSKRVALTVEKPGNGDGPRISE